MSTPEIPTAEVEAVEGVILKSPKIRGVVAATAGVAGIALTALTAGFAVVHQSPVWLQIGYAIYGVVAPAAFGIWKANIR